MSKVISGLVGSIPAHLNYYFSDTLEMPVSGVLVWRFGLLEEELVLGVLTLLLLALELDLLLVDDEEFLLLFLLLLLSRFCCCW